MKPWRPYWKQLDFLTEMLLRKVGRPPFQYPRGTYDWITKLTFYDLFAADSSCRFLSTSLPSKTFEYYGPSFEGSNHLWQIILRCECAIDFCRGIVEKRADYDWSQKTGRNLSLVAD